MSVDFLTLRRSLPNLSVFVVSLTNLNYSIPRLKQIKRNCSNQSKKTHTDCVDIYLGFRIGKFVWSSSVMVYKCSTCLADIALHGGSVDTPPPLITPPPHPLRKRTIRQTDRQTDSTESSMTTLTWLGSAPIQILCPPRPTPFYMSPCLSYYFPILCPFYRPHSF